MNKSPSRNISFFYTKTIRLIHLTVQEAVAVDVYLGWMKDGCCGGGKSRIFGLDERGVCEGGKSRIFGLDERWVCEGGKSRMFGLDVRWVCEGGKSRMFGLNERWVLWGREIENVWVE